MQKIAPVIFSGMLLIMHSVGDVPRAHAAPAQRGLDCRCLRDAQGSSDLCYGYNLSLGIRRLEITEGETSGSGPISKTIVNGWRTYTSKVTTMTGQHYWVRAVRSKTGLTQVYTGSRHSEKLSFVASCK